MMLFGGITVNLLNLVPVLPLDGGQIMAACVRQFGPRGRSSSELGAADFCRLFRAAGRCGRLSVRTISSLSFLTGYFSGFLRQMR